MVDNLQIEFDRLTEKYMYHMSSSDEEIAVEYQIPTPSRRQKRKISASPTPTQGKLKIQKTQIDDEEPKCSTSVVQELYEDDSTTNDVTKASEEVEQDLDNDDQVEKEDSKVCKKTHEKGKKRHRHGKHSKVHKKKLHGSKSKHSKKHSKRTGVEKKLKHKHARTKRVETEVPEPQMKRRESQESMTSSNNRSASPLPSIHTLSPSPTQDDKMESDEEANEESGPATCKTKSVTIVNCKAAEFTNRSSMERDWKSDLLKDIREKTLKSLNKKEKNQTLRETIEKLKTKNNKYREPSLFTSLFTPRSGRRVEKKPYYKEDSEEDFSDDEALESIKAKCNNKKITKKNCTKTKSTSQALEEAVKDISKWLDEIPATSIVSPLSNSPAPTVSTEEQDSSSRQDDEVSVGEKTVSNRKDFTRKRLSSREPKLAKRREIQRTIDRLQPGKSKGNLLTNVPKSIDRVDDNSSPANANSVDSNQTDEAGPKLNLGSVLPTVNFSLQLTQDFNKDVLTEEKTTMVTKVTESECTSLATDKEEPPEIVVPTAKKDVEKENTAVVFSKQSQEKATPNLSAWFKAFGAPKAAGPVNCTKKKTKEAENDEKAVESEPAEVKATPKLNSNKVDSPNNPNSPNHDGGDSSHASTDTLVLSTQWPRRTSTGSSISEQSSFSQDLDSPRQLISHTSPLLRSPASPLLRSPASPLLRSPASPRSYDDYQKSYSIVNGTVRAGFYQDTTSIKSSPDKVCSPREAPHSPYSPCPLYVYASASATQGAATPNYFVDPNKSPLLTNSQTTTLYYEANKTSVPNKTLKPNDNLSPVTPSYSPRQTNYTQNSSHLPLNSAQAQSNLVNETKTTFPMKKRTYNELEQAQAAAPCSQQQQTAPCVKVANNTSTETPSAINCIKQYAALTEKCQLANGEPKYTEHINDTYDLARASKNPDADETFEMTMKNEIGMVNMNYFLSDESRQNNVSSDVEYFGREAKSTVSKTPRRYEIDSMAMNSQQLPKPLSKPDISSYNFIPAHSHDRHNDMNMNNQTIAHAHQTPYDSLSQQIGGLCFNDIELANKKLYTNNISRTPLDYANWKDTNQMRTQEHLPIDFSYINSNDKSLQQQHYYNYAVPRITSHKSQIINQIPASELKVPNPRGMKSDVQSTLTNIPQNNPFVSSLSYKSAYTSHSTLLDSIKPMRNDNDPYLPSFTNALYSTKQFEMAQVFGKTMVNSPGSSSIIYTQARNDWFGNEPKRISKRLRRTMESKPLAPSQAYAASSSSSGNNALRSEKRSLLRPTLCEFGSTNMAIDGMYTNDPIYNIGNIRNTTDQIMAANYMAAAVANQRHNGATAEKLVQPAHQNSHSGGSFPFIAHSQLGAGYPYVNPESSSPLYQQYIQRYQDMQRQTGAQIMGLYPPTYPPTLGVRQPYDSADLPPSK